MDFFPESSISPLDMLIEKATRPELSGPDWSTNMHISDIINSKPSSADDGLKKILLRIQSNDENVVFLSLSLLEATVKNGGTDFHKKLASNAVLMNELIALTDGSKGSKNADLVLSLIQQWAIAFHKDQPGKDNELRVFHDTYVKLKLKNMPFPDLKVSESGAESEPLSQRLSVCSSNSSNSSPTKQRNHPSLEEEFQKLHRDLDSVMEKIELRKSLNAVDQRGETVEDVVDFLTQCQPRMSALIEAGIAGKLDEKTLERCLSVNDSLVLVLDGDMSEEVGGTSSDSAHGTVKAKDLFDFSFEESKLFPSKPSSSTDDFGLGKLSVRESNSKTSLVNESNIDTTRQATPTNVPPPPAPQEFSSLSSLNENFDEFIGARSNSSI